jgi:hypothetical protein
MSACRTSAALSQSQCSKPRQHGDASTLVPSSGSPRFAVAAFDESGAGQNAIRLLVGRRHGIVVGGGVLSAVQEAFVSECAMQCGRMACCWRERRSSRDGRSPARSQSRTTARSM